MTATTIDPRTALRLRRLERRLLIAVAIAAVLLAAAFVVGRITAPDHTVRSIVTVPATVHQAADICRLGRPC